MSSIDISLANDPLQKCYAFAPGEKLRILVTFESPIPDKYRLQILDKRNNTRLNRYGKGSDRGISLDWLIPTTIRPKHLGTWYIQVKEYPANKLISKSLFYVEHQQRIEAPMLHSGPVVLGLPDSVTKPIPIEQEADIHIPVTAVKGLGKTYAARLITIEIVSVYQFFHYPNRVKLAETMRVTDKKLDQMFEYADNLLKQEIKLPVVSKKIIVETDSSELLAIPGIGPKSVEKLAKLGIYTKNDFSEYKDLDIVRKTLRMSVIRFNKLLSIIGREPIIDKFEISPDLLIHPVISIKGIGIKTAEKLSSKGIKTVNDLLNSSFSALEDITSEITYQKWIKSVKSYTVKDEKVKRVIKKITENELLQIPGIGPKSVDKLRKLGIKTQEDLLDYEDLEKLRKTLRMSINRLKNLLAVLKDSTKALKNSTL
jgi:nucleotidyltransferase/DNA polymerase involved in DNA repair